MVQKSLTQTIQFWRQALTTPDPQTVQLNDRQKHVMRLMALGFSIKDAAKKLGVSESTIGILCRTAREQTGTHSRPGLVLWYLQYVLPGEPDDLLTQWRQKAELRRAQIMRRSPSRKAIETAMALLNPEYVDLEDAEVAARLGMTESVRYELLAPLVGTLPSRSRNALISVLYLAPLPMDE